MGETDFYGTFANRVRRRRQVVGKSGAEVARFIGMGQPQYHRLEHGQHRSIQLEQLARLAQALETSADYLLLLSDDQGIIPPSLCPGGETCFDGAALLPAIAPHEEGRIAAQYTPWPLRVP